MRETCPACGHRFLREPGFFLGAMYVSYALAVLAYGLIVLLVRFLRPSWTETISFVAALPLFLPLVPPIVRYSRVIWMHLDWTLDPGAE
jgi:hypothetical protein